MFVCPEKRPSHQGHRRPRQHARMPGISSKTCAPVINNHQSPLKLRCVAFPSLSWFFLPCCGTVTPVCDGIDSVEHLRFEVVKRK